MGTKASFVGELGEAIATLPPTARIAYLVLPEMLALNESPEALLTLEGPLASVQAKVVLEVTCIEESLATELALVGAQGHRWVGGGQYRAKRVGCLQGHGA